MGRRARFVSSLESHSRCSCSSWTGERYDESSFERKSLECSLHSAQIFLAAIALKGSNLGDVEHLSVDARELAMTARQASVDLIALWMHAPALRESIRYATQNTFVELSFSAVSLFRSRGSTILLTLLVPTVAAPQALATLPRRRLAPASRQPVPRAAGSPAPVSRCRALCHHCHVRPSPPIPAADTHSAAPPPRVALERFSKAYAIELPIAAPPESANGAGGDYLGGYGPGASSFDISALPVFSDPNWIGNDAVPGWLNDPLAWSFTDLDLSAGLDKIFLPSWSTQVDAYGGGGFGEW